MRRIDDEGHLPCRKHVTYVGMTLAHAFGHFAGDASGPEMTAVIESVIASAAAAGKATGFVHSNPQVLKKWQEKGMTIFSCGSELNMIKNGVKKNRQEFIG